MINPDLDFEKLNQEYQEKKRIIIPDFLQPEWAEQIYQGFQEITTRNLWYQTNYGNPNFYDKNLKDKQNHIGTANFNGHFSYKFEKFPVKNIGLEHLILVDSHRQDISKLKPIWDRPELELPESHPFLTAGNFINSDEAHDIITRITGKQLTKSGATCFASRYTAGNYLATHDDRISPRIIAFVLNFTRHWLLHWGGNLAILDEKRENIIETYQPKFNSMILFDVPLPHVVLPVSIYCQSERLALSGWYHKQNLPLNLNNLNKK